MTSEHDAIVVGGGIGGLSLAHFLAARGRAVCLLEADARLGGALHSARFPDEGGADFWLELGAHTGYNSYGRLLGIAEALGLLPALVRRETARWMLWRDGAPHSIPSQLGWLELAACLPRLLSARRAGATVADYYGRVLGWRNFARVVRPMLSAVVSQDAAQIPADLLFKKRPRRKELPRSYAVQGGLQSIAEAIAAHLGGQPGCAVHTDAPVARIERAGAAWRCTTARGETHAAPLLALATAPDVAARLLGEAAPQLAGLLAPLAVARVESEAVVVRADRVALPPVAGLVGVDAPFRSVVARDPVPHADWRGFTFHFRPETPTADRETHICTVLGIDAAAIEHRAGAARTLPAPVTGHADRIAQVDAALAAQAQSGPPLVLTGNWFGGLAIEDCVARSWAEAERSG